MPYSENLSINLYHLSIYCKLDNSIHEVFKIDNTRDSLVVRNFLQAVQNGYRRNPYHNALHGADVANSVAFFATNGLQEYYNDLEISCLIISALVHDIGHPGILSFV